MVYIKTAKGIKAVELLLQGKVIEGGGRHYRFNEQKHQVEYSDDKKTWVESEIAVNSLLNWDKWNVAED